MAHPVARKTHEIERLEVRISSDKKSILKNAADLSVKDCDVFIRALLNPPAPSDNLVKAAKKYKKDVISK